MVARLLPALYVLVLCTHSCSSLYLFLEEGSTRCFQEELEPEENVMVYYRSPQLNLDTRLAQYYAKTGSSHLMNPDFGPPLGIHVQVMDPEGFIIHQETLAKEEDSMEFNSLELWGEHNICFRTNASHWWSRELFQLYLDIETGVDAKDSHNPWNAPVAQADSIKALAIQVEHIKAKMEEIKSVNHHMIERDEAFRMTSESTYNRVWMSALIQVAIAVSVALYQLQSLKTFLMAKKLV